MQIVKNTTILYEPLFPLSHDMPSEPCANTKKEELTCVNSSLQFIQLCDSGRIQTCNLLIRSQMLYSVELRSQKLFKALLLESGCKGKKCF